MKNFETKRKAEVYYNEIANGIRYRIIDNKCGKNWVVGEGKTLKDAIYDYMRLGCDRVKFGALDEFVYNELKEHHKELFDEEGYIIDDDEYNKIFNDYIDNRIDEYDLFRNLSYSNNIIDDEIRPLDLIEDGDCVSLKNDFDEDYIIDLEDTLNDLAKLTQYQDVKNTPEYDDDFDIICNAHEAIERFGSDRESLIQIIKNRMSSYNDISTLDIVKELAALNVDLKEGVR